MNGPPDRERLAPPSLPEDLGIFRAMGWCLAFDLLLVALFLGWRGLAWLL